MSLAKGLGFLGGLILAMLSALPAQSDAVMRVILRMAAETNLVRDPSLEQTRDGQFTAWRPAPQGWRVAPGEGRSGTAALACEAATSTGWRGASQTVTLDGTGIAPLRVRGWSRAEDVSGSPDGALYYTLFNDGDAQAMGRLRPAAGSVKDPARATATELLNGERLSWNGRGWPVTLDPAAATVVRVTFEIKD